MADFKTSLLISTYNWPEALRLVFESIIVQHKLPSEILIADDGSGDETHQVIDDYRKKLTIPVKHVWHTNEGFRKTIIMNKAIHQSEGDYIIQIDGDMILHQGFISDHIKNAKQNYFIKGSRGMLNQALTNELIKKKQVKINLTNSGVGSKINATRFPLLSPLFYGNPIKTNDLRGCNFAFWKKDFIAVNGYNNDLLGWGHEDIELAARLVNAGIKRRQLKMVAVCYHMYHKLNERNSEDLNMQEYNRVVKSRVSKCKNGFTKRAY